MVKRRAGIALALETVLAQGVSDNVTVGVAAAVGWLNDGETQLVESRAGKLSLKGNTVGKDALFDLASLTKPVVATAALRMHEAKHIDIDAPLVDFLSEAESTLLANTTLRDLLTHQSGLMAWAPLYASALATNPLEKAIAKDFVKEILTTAEYCGHARPLYSDLGYILAGEAIARSSQQTLSEIINSWVLEPLGIGSACFYMAEKSAVERSRLSLRTAATERCLWRGRLLQGEVHDENCSAMGGVSGHAGLFGTARAYAMFGVEMLKSVLGQSSFLSKETMRMALAPTSEGTLRLGWDTKSTHESSAGSRFSSASFGHLGFTGTSMWCDPERALVCVLLTNRVCETRTNERIRHFRPRFHDTVAEVFDRLT